MIEYFTPQKQLICSPVRAGIQAHVGMCKDSNEPAESDQCLGYPTKEILDLWLPIEHPLKTLIRCNHLIRPNKKLEDLKVLRRSPDLFNHVKIGKGQLQGI